MDEIARYNLARWQALVEALAVFTRPELHLDPSRAQALLDPEQRLGDVAGKAVLCLAAGGGQQSIAFALRGAQVTVVDLSDAQLHHDRQAAAQYGLEITLLQADMRDLSALDGADFDIVYQPYSLGFVPDAQLVFEQVAQVIRPSGLYYFMCANPFVLGLGPQDWNGQGYTLKHPYINGTELRYDDPAWVYDRSKSASTIAAPREYRHTLSTLVSGLVSNGFVIMHLSDYSGFTPDLNAEPGTWAHMLSIAPPWLSFWSSYRPEVLTPAG
jgi:2-polyprenyl-3-methyl-5-hydroxy-6-metoxy-1,4-benzoquinol methylase